MRRLIGASIVLLVVAGCGEEDLEFPGGETTTPTAAVTSTATPGPTSTPTPTPTT